MQIWVDADACPKAIKDILFRAAQRTRVTLVLVANQPLKTPVSPYIRSVSVKQGFDVADNYIVKHVQPDDLVITADIPLAAEVIKQRGYALNPRGEFYSVENIGERLNLRDFMEELRGTGVRTGGPAALNAADRQAFANQLDRFLSRQANR